MKTKVIVTLRAEHEVEYEVEHKEGEDPTDLTPDEEKRILAEAPNFVVRWEPISYTDVRKA